MPNEVHKITIELERPRGSFPGRVEVGYYVFTEGKVILTDERGAPIGAERYIGLDCPNHRNVACVLLRQRTRGTAASRSFNRPIQYRDTGWR